MAFKFRRRRFLGLNLPVGRREARRRALANAAKVGATTYLILKGPKIASSIGKSVSKLGRTAGEYASGIKTAAKITRNLGKATQTVNRTSRGLKGIRQGTRSFLIGAQGDISRSARNMRVGVKRGARKMKIGISRGIRRLRNPFGRRS